MVGLSGPFGKDSGFAMKKFLLLGIISLIWGSQFYFNEIALQALPPLTIAAGRSVLAALTLAILLAMSKESQTVPAAKRMPFMAAFWIAVVDASLPFTLITWGQVQIDSGTAAILVGTIPLFVVMLAPLVIASERLAMGSLLSVGLGFISLLVLNHGVFSHGFGGSLLAQLSVLGGAACFAAGLVFIKRMNSPAFIRTARDILIGASLQLVPLALWVDRPWTLDWSPSTLGALAFLGVVNAGLAYLLYVVLIAKAGPTFASLSNYLVPMVGMTLGISFLGEAFDPVSLVALAILFAALALNGYQGPKRGGNANEKPLPT